MTLRNSLYALLGIVVLTLVLFALAVYQLYQNKLLTVDEKLTEISGIEFDKKNQLWAINDSGDDPNIYQLAQDGSISRTIRISNAKNIDWEDMTQDDFGHFFLGDFGNNDNNRKWLTIYKIENPIDIKGDSTQAEIIKFTYSDQESFPAKQDNKNFDLEAFVFYQDHLYLFTKNRKKPFDGKTNLYKIGDHAANFNAKKVSSFTTCTHSEKLCWITSAALSPNRKKLALLDSERVWIFENWEGDDFFSGDAYKIDLGIVTQKEAITFYDDETLIFTDEEYMGIGRNVYVLELDETPKELVIPNDSLFMTFKPLKAPKEKTPVEVEKIIFDSQSK